MGAPSSICMHCGRDRRERVATLKEKPGSQAFEKAKAEIQACPECRYTLYLPYRRLTGECETCGQSMATHKKCALCGIFLGSGHDSYGTIIEGKDRCGHCHPQDRIYVSKHAPEDQRLASHLPPRPLKARTKRQKEESGEIVKVRPVKRKRRRKTKKKLPGITTAEIRATLDKCNKVGIGMQLPPPCRRAKGKLAPGEEINDSAGTICFRDKITSKGGDNHERTSQE